jgi:hypothetical protein|tara:strand:+ start:647 stop:973 length:327 start_codon:yes stop_codon:yes gene_type:complete
MFDLSDISNPTKEQLAKEMEGIPQHFVNYVHGKCEGDYHNNPEQRNAYMREYHKEYRENNETPEQRENRRQKQKLSDAKRHKETYHLRKDEYNARRRERYTMKKKETV